jgi:hypothetical protein
MQDLTVQQFVFQMAVLDFLMVTNDPSRENLQTLYKIATKLDLVSWYEETAHVTSDILAD